MEFGGGSDCACKRVNVASIVTGETSPGGEEESIHERVQALREKTCDLSETLDEVEETLLEAQRESNEERE